MCTLMVVKSNKPTNTVDGQNPAPVDKQVIRLFTGFHTSQVVQDFVHQQDDIPAD